MIHIQDVMAERDRLRESNRELLAALVECVERMEVADCESTRNCLALEEARVIIAKCKGEL